MKKRMLFCLLAVATSLVATFSCRQDKTHESAKFVVKFDEKIKATKADLSKLSSGDVVNEGEELTFSASSKAEEGQLISKWIVNGKEIDGSANSWFSYKAKKDGAPQEGSLYVLAVDFETTSSEKIVVNFDEIISCKNATTYAKKSSGDEVADGEELDFFAAVSDDAACENWVINGLKLPSSSSPNFKYKVAMKDAVLENEVATINFSVNIVKATKLTIKFDDAKIRAVDGNQKALFSGDEVSSRDVITFTANVEEGFTVDSWFVKGVAQEGQNSRDFVYSPNEKDAVNEGGKKVVTVSCNKKGPQKVKIVFDSDKIYTSSGLESGAMVNEGTFILFNSRYTANSYSPTWYINDKKQPAQTLGGDASFYDNFVQTFKYTVDIKDAVDENNEKVIKFDYKTPDKKKKLTITFPTDVTVIIPGAGKVNSGYQISSGDDIGIQVNYGVEGEGAAQNVALDAWYLNGKKIAHPKVSTNPTIYNTAGSSLGYLCRLTEEDADKDDKINITYKTHPRQKIQITFDSETIKAFKGPNVPSAKTSFDSGSMIKEDTFVSFQNVAPETEFFDNNFYFNGRRWETLLSSDCYLVNSRDAIDVDGVLTLNVTSKLRPKKQVKVVWDDANMKGIMGQGSGAVNVVSGATVQEGSTIIFKYENLPEGKVIRGFFTDGRDDSHNLARGQNSDKVQGCIFTVALEYCKKEGDEYILHPRFQIDDAQMVTITLGSGVGCVYQDNGKTVSSGTEIQEGTGLKFTASSSQVHSWFVGIKEIEGGRTTLANPSFWAVNKEWAKKVNGKYVANISFE
ncbi:MAG: hypothetical protein ACTTJ3_03770 [Treponema sp.]